MKSALHTKIFLGLTILLLSLATTQSWAQNKLFMNPVKYTDRQKEIYMSPCSDVEKIHLYVNGTLISPSHLRTKYIVGTYYAFEMDFGLMKPGDILKATDDCGSIPFEQVVKDDYVYVEVPAGTGHSGNGIGPNDENYPYSRLSTPVNVGKCAPIAINSHGLVNYYISSPQTNGTFLINGSPLTDTPSTINPGGYDINFNGYMGPSGYVINPDGSITTSTPGVKLESNTHFSGDIPLSIEYHHGGVNPPNDLSFGFKAMSFRHLGNFGYEIEKASLGGNINTKDYTTTNANSVYKLTYDGVYYRAYVNNVLVDELRRFIQYDVSSGTLTPGSSAGLDYNTSVTWTGMESGNQWVSVLVDGVLYTRQQFNVAEDIIINPSVLDVACNGESNGKITVSTTGGLAPLLYALDNGGFQSNPVFSGLSPGNYVIKVRDASGCTASRNVTVGNPTILTATVASKTNVSCSGGTTGSVTLSATGGSSPYLYSKDGVNYVTTPDFSGLSAGNFTFYIKDDNSCIATVNETLSSNSNLVATVESIQNVSCNGGNSGAFTISTMGSVVNGSLQFSIDNGITFQSGNSFTGISAGTYPIVVKDNSCSIALSATISQPGALTINPSQEKAVSCNGLSDGRIKVTASSGVSPYQFSIDGNTYSSDSIFTGLAAGNYKVWVKDANGCIKESSIIQVTQPAVVSVSVFNKNDVTCFGGTNGSFTLTGTGGTSPYQYSKDGTTYQASSSFTTLSAGTFSLTLKDANGCSATTSGEILQPSDILISAAIDNIVSCFGGANGQIQVVASGGTGLLKYAIDGTTFGNSAIFSGLSAGNYQITVIDSNGAFSTTTERLAMPKNVLATVQNDSTVVLTWDKDVSHLSYKLVYDDGNGHPRTAFPTANPSGNNSFTVTGLDSTLTYTFTLVAVGKNSSGGELLSDPAQGSFTTKAAEPCSQPLTIYTTVNPDYKGFKLTWTPIPGQTGTIVRYRKVQNPEAFWTTNSLLGTNELTVNNLITGSQYEYKAMPLCGSDSSKSEAGGFVFLSKDKVKPTVAYQCGANKRNSDINRTPLDVPLQVGDYILIGDFPAQIDVLDTKVAPYKGLAHVLVPYLGLSTFLMEFTGLQVNIDNEVIAGEMHSITNPDALAAVKKQNAERAEKQKEAVMQVIDEVKELIQEIAQSISKGDSIPKSTYDIYVQKQNEVITELNGTDPTLAAELKEKADALMAIYLKPEYLIASTNDYKPKLSEADQNLASELVDALIDLNDKAKTSTTIGQPPTPSEQIPNNSIPTLSYQDLMRCAEASHIGVQSGQKDCATCSDSQLCYYGSYYPGSPYEYWYDKKNKIWIARETFVDEKFVYFTKDTQGDWHEHSFVPSGMPQPLAEVIQQYAGFSVIADAIENTVVYGSVIVGTGGSSLWLQSLVLAYTEEGVAREQGMSVEGVAEKAVRNFLVGKTLEIGIAAMVKAYPTLVQRLTTLLKKKGKDIEVELPKWGPNNWIAVIGKSIDDLAEAPVGYQFYTRNEQKFIRRLNASDPNTPQLTVRYGKIVQATGKVLTNADEIKLLLKTEVNKAFFWSGRTSNGVGVMDMASDIAQAKGGNTLEGLLEKYKIEMPEFNNNTPSIVKLWEDVSALYANQVIGEVRAVLGKNLRSGNIWETIELPRLKQNSNVTKIYAIDPETKNEILLWTR